MTAMARQWTTNGTHRVPYWIYTDPDIYAEEQLRIFEGRAWNFVGLEAEFQIPAISSARTSARPR